MSLRPATAALGVRLAAVGSTEAGRPESGALTLVVRSQARGGSLAAVWLAGPVSCDSSCCV
ncbi:hypothetical protein E2562_021444 [Oryza meyeriana var. granulata]|uniref:Uncharacterized protein n=1 Tax=Oryza meyeriana var. granulata TaxID=110450 RepID=A0A6G1C7V5_9ORYZ|nr:hypothetical protein E2562_021444 [Oryza meyeriana var. granulata]